ncbi:hypothetical protein N7524_007507 [Penicillium chrysogenum]|nr:hypothetical protein N7524_007507 [Penicillium chrysogenum]
MPSKRLSKRMPFQPARTSRLGTTKPYLLDPKSLPTPKGPLDEFTIAEKVTTERFMREAGYGLSLAN